MSGTTIYFTVATKSYLAHGRALATRIRELDSTADFFLFLADEPDGYFQPESESFKCILLDAYVPEEDKYRLTFGYSQFELCNALKAYAHLYIQNETSANAWFYFDSDILLIDLPQPFHDASPEHSVIATPHLIRLDPSKLTALQEQRFLHHGMLNGGFLAVRRSADSHIFIAWFVSRLREACFNHSPFLYVDQLWMNMLISFAPALIWRHPGANVAYWNLHERSVQLEATGDWSVNGQPLLFVHFSNWNDQTPDVVSKDNPRLPAPDCWLRLASLYLNALVAHGLCECKCWPYSFRHFSDGSEIKPYQRKAWLRLTTAEQNRLSNPFEAAKYFNKHLAFKRLMFGIKQRVQQSLQLVEAKTC